VAVAHVLHVAQPVVGQADAPPSSAAATPPQREWPTTMMCRTCSTSAANWITERQLRSPCADRRWRRCGARTARRQQVDQLVRRHPAVGAADPEVLRRLLPRSLVKKPGERRSVASAQRRLRLEQLVELGRHFASSSRAAAALSARAAVTSARRRLQVAEAAARAAPGAREHGEEAAQLRPGVAPGLVHVDQLAHLGRAAGRGACQRSVRRSRVRSRAL
jgi:hypothetical protein